MFGFQALINSNQSGTRDPFKNNDYVFLMPQKYLLTISSKCKCVYQSNPANHWSILGRSPDKNFLNHLISLNILNNFDGQSGGTLWPKNYHEQFPFNVNDQRFMYL